MSLISIVTLSVVILHLFFHLCVTDTWPYQHRSTLFCFNGCVVPSCADAPYTSHWTTPVKN